MKSLFQKIKDNYKKYFFKTPLTPLIYFVLNGMVSVESRIKHFTFPKVYLRVWRLDMLRDRYEKDTTRLFERIIKPGMTVVDVGAHIGYFTRLFAKYTGPTGRVYAFEPDPTNFAFLKKNTKHLNNVNIFQLALADRSGMIDFFHSELKSGCHSTIPSPLRQTKLSVPVCTLDELVKKEKINRVDIIKMDIEGGEMAAYRGMSEIAFTNPDLQIIMEFNPECFVEAHIKSVAFLEQLMKDGFKIFVIRPGVLEEIHEGKKEEEIIRGQSFVNILCTKNAPHSVIDFKII